MENFPTHLYSKGWISFIGSIHPRCCGAVSEVKSIQLQSSRWTQDSSIQLNSQAHLVKPVMCIFMKMKLCKNDNYVFDKESVLGETCFACLHLLEKVGKIHHRRQEGYIQDFELVSKENIVS